MKNNNKKLYKIIWLIGVYLVLAIILYLVILYKVEWEHKDLNTYLYFYECNKNLCTTTTSQNNYYSRIQCNDDICPYITDIIETNVILEREDKTWLYDYINNKTINNSYLKYNYIGNDNFIVTNDLNKQGIIDLSGNTIIEPNYEYIESYNNNLLLYKENDTYKVKNREQIYELDNNFTHVVLINDNIFAAKKENVYQIYSYNDLNNEYSMNTYDYIYAYQDIIFTIKNKKIDILTTDLNSTLLMKINTYYEYKTEKERETLEININNGNLYFNVFNNETNYKTYIYNVGEKKLI